MSIERFLNPTSDGKDYAFLGYRMGLTPTEHRILQYLVQMEGSAVRARELCAHCYRDAEVDRANVSVRINSINQKARRIGGRKLLRFARGRGYLFCDDL